MDVQLIDPKLLIPHGINKELYETFNAEGSELLISIRENGILEPIIIKEDRTIISGHRRTACAIYLSMGRVPTVQVLEGLDDRVAIVEANRYRTKTFSERMREAALLAVVESEKAATRRAFKGVEESEAGTTREKVAEAVGMKPISFMKVNKVWEASKTNENAKAIMSKLDAGTISVDAAHKAVRTLISPPKVHEDRPEFIRVYNSWVFGENDPRFGIPHPGRVPGQIAGNLIYYYTQPGDLVVDPMAGGGSTLDVAKFMGREALGYDVVPKRPDVEQWDISKGFPEECQDAQLIFMDPPYWNVIDEKYSEKSSSALSLEKFREWLVTLIANASQTVKIGGFISLLIMPQYFRLPEDYEHGYIDWPYEVMEYMRWERLGLAPWNRIHTQWPSSGFTAYDVENAKEGKHMLPVSGDIVVGRRVR
jgi:hypothetical protein